MTTASEVKGSAPDHNDGDRDYKQKYTTLKRKLRSLVYEHELLQEQLEKAQKKLLRVSRDRSFLLDRMLQYEKVAESSSDSDATDMSESDTEKPPKKKHSQPSEAAPDSAKKSKSSSKPKKSKSQSKKAGQLSMEDIEKHLESRPKAPSIEKATLSMPSDIFSTPESDDETSDNDTQGLVIDMK